MKLHYPAADRNAGPIGDALEPLLDGAVRVLELASGTGQHAAAFVKRFSDVVWQPSDCSEEALRSISAWRHELGNDRLLPPVRIDVVETWPVGTFDVVYCANMVHIAPPECIDGLMRGASQHLRQGGILLTYGPYIFEDVDTAASNLEFDKSLRSRDPRWGIRQFREVEAVARRYGLLFEERTLMPANNACLRFRNG